MDVRMTQHSVGQGGMFSGLLDAGGKPFRWVYDCGSNQLDSLVREINRVARWGDIDMLFLSHLDSDHVCGVDLLLSQVSVREVVLPYFDKEVLFALVARDISRGRMSTTFAELVEDIPGWFQDRGVERVTQIRGDDDDGGEGPGLELPDGGDGEGDIVPQWLPELAAVETGASLHLRQADPGSVVALSASSRWLNWALIPHVHIPPRRLMSAFKTALEEEFGDSVESLEIIEVVKGKKGRDSLRRCYDALWLDHNLVSMTLYSGPTRHHAGDSGILPYARSGELQGGWMLTGDASFHRRKRLEQFVERYRCVAPLINVVMLPHHGSTHNFSEALLDACPNYRIGYAATGPNSYGHPHQEVARVVERRARFQRVSQKHESELELRFRIGR